MARCPPSLGGASGPESPLLSAAVAVPRGRCHGQRRGRHRLPPCHSQAAAEWLKTPLTRTEPRRGKRPARPPLVTAARRQAPRTRRRPGPRRESPSRTRHNSPAAPPFSRAPDRCDTACRGLRRFVNSGNLPQIALARAERPRSHPRSRRPQTCGGLYPQPRADHLPWPTPMTWRMPARPDGEIGRAHV